MTTSDRILAHIKANGPASRTDLMEALGIEKSCCTKNLQNLRDVKQMIHQVGEKKAGRRGYIPIYGIGAKPIGGVVIQRQSDAMPICTGEPKKCTCCNQTFPQTLEYYGPVSHLKGGLDTHCRACRRKKNHANHQRRNPKVVERMDKDLPMVPVERIDMGDGVTRVRFGHGWKPSPAQRMGSSAGYASALSNNMEAPM